MMMMQEQDEIEKPVQLTLCRDKHVSYILSLDPTFAKQASSSASDETKNTKNAFAHALSENLRVSAVYWGVTALDLLGAVEDLDKEKVTSFILSCYNESDGGFGGAPRYDSHLLYTLSALQVLATLGTLHTVSALELDKTATFISGLQNQDGSFCGDRWGEVDARFSFCAVASLTIIQRTDMIDKEKAVQFVTACQNFDCAFGAVPNAESHAAMVFCCLGTLDLLGKTANAKDLDTLAWWLSERQTACGGLNGRPAKLEDVCYSWWALSSLCMLKKSTWLDQKKLVDFILRCQDLEKGGIRARPDSPADVFHTLFGLCGLSLLGYPGLTPVDPTFCMSTRTTGKLRLRKP